MNFDLELDLISSEAVRALVQADERFTREIYDALCNNKFIHRDMEQPEDYWSCSWRYAGDVASNLEMGGGGYLEHYCTGNESHISPRVAKLMADLGWVGHPYPVDDNQ